MNKLMFWTDGFFGLEDVEKVLHRENSFRGVARPPIGTRLHLLERD